MNHNPNCAVFRLGDIRAWCDCESMINPKRVWCDHCNAEIRIVNVRGCLRKPCKAKEQLPDARKVFK